MHRKRWCEIDHHTKMGADETKDELLQHYEVAPPTSDGHRGSRCWTSIFLTAVITATCLHIAQTVHVLMHKVV